MVNIVGIGVLALIALNFYGWFRLITQRDDYYARLRELEASLPQVKYQAGQDAIKKSHSVIRGKVTEELVSLIPGFPYVGSDCKFLGMPLDYLVFEGMSEVRDGEAPELKSIVFVDVKTGKASLSPVERAIKRCVEAGNVRFETWRKTDTGIDIQGRVE